GGHTTSRRDRSRQQMGEGTARLERAAVLQVLELERQRDRWHVEIGSIDINRGRAPNERCDHGVRSGDVVAVDALQVSQSGQRLPPRLCNPELLHSRDKNFEVARLFDEIARSMDMQGEQGHRPRAYRRAARGVAGYQRSIEELAAEGRLRDIPGVGASLEALIAEYLATGGMDTHARLVEAHPPGLAPLLLARGFGPAAVETLHARTGVTDLDDVERIAREGLLAEAIGPKRAADLVAQLPALRNPIRRLRLKTAAELAGEVLDLLGNSGPVSVSGPARRTAA